MKVFEADATFSSILTADATGIRDVKIAPSTAIDIFLSRLTALLPQDDASIDLAVIKVLIGRNIPLPESLQRDGPRSPEFVVLE